MNFKKRAPWVGAAMIVIIVAAVFLWPRGKAPAKQVLAGAPKLPSASPPPTSSERSEMTTSAPAAAVARRTLAEQLAAKLRAILDEPPSPNRRQAIEDFAAALARHDPEQAANLAAAMLNDKATKSADVYAFVSGFTSEYAALHPAKAAVWSEFLPEHLKFTAFTFVAQAWSKENISAATTWAETIGDPSLRSSVLRRMGEVLQQAGDPAGASAWAQRIAASRDGAAQAEMVGRLWAKTDAESAFEWVSQLDDPTHRSNGMVALASAVADEDPVAASSWVEKFPEGELRNQAILATSTRWSEKDPAAAANWVARVGDPQLFEASMHSIARRWLEKDRAKAIEWIANAPLSDRARSYLLPKD